MLSVICDVPASRHRPPSAQIQHPQSCSWGCRFDERFVRRSNQEVHSVVFPGLITGPNLGSPACFVVSVGIRALAGSGSEVHVPVADIGQARRREQRKRCSFGGDTIGTNVCHAQLAVPHTSDINADRRSSCGYPT